MLLDNFFNQLARSMESLSADFATKSSANNFDWKRRMPPELAIVPLLRAVLEIRRKSQREGAVPSPRPRPLFPRSLKRPRPREDDCWSITAVDIYKRLLEKERNVDDTFAFNLIRPIGSVAGELIWPRTYDSSNELTFDENGVAYPLHERPSLSRILGRSRISVYNGNIANKEGYNYYRKFR
ncbi:unnamed protein product [Angiostrongylus costaricensis]|uniref:Uncharacterized protein n=1 Tax=Angiostrongylus costaricensis TaxID=334426 RepID=A0A158PGX4_ANGCS|nr:unnamed protein product [Angiostrongylus costaricensis]